MIDIPAKPWVARRLPKRILVIRLQAMGDVVATLPYLQQLRNNLPASVQLDFLTREETRSIPSALILFDRVYAIGGERNLKKQLLHTFLLLPKLLSRRYDVIIDLQHNLISAVVRKTLRPRAWSLFDRYSPIHGGERYRLTIEAAGIPIPGSARIPTTETASLSVNGEVRAPVTGSARISTTGSTRTPENKTDGGFRLKDPDTGPRILQRAGWNGKDGLVVLNPAGAFETRHWEMDKYVSFARIWLERYPDTRFLTLGTSFIASKAAFLQEQLGDKLIDLVGKTHPAEAFAVLQQALLVLSEDSGLMHMAWCSGIPTLALLGSTRSDWSRPLGKHSFFFDSSDLPCGNCMESTCKYGDIHCMTRLSARAVAEQAMALLDRLEDKQQNPVYVTG